MAYRSDPRDVCTFVARLDEEFCRIDFPGNLAGESVQAKPELILLDDIEQTGRNLVYGRFCCCQEAG